MIRKSIFLLTLAVAMCFASCEKYDHAIADIEDRLDKIEDSLIKTIEQQIANINTSINDLKGVDAELKGYIESLQTTATDLQSKIDATNGALVALESDLEGQLSASEQKVLDELNTVKTALEGQLATINNTIATLQAKDVELDKKIADLQTYVDSEITATEDWAIATFSTLEQYEAIQTAISEINALIKSTQESITALEEKLGKKIADDITAAVADVNADIAAKVTEITNGYTTAIADATDAITAAYTDAIKTAITASETSMKEWVNSVLAEGYYTKAEIDGKITALQTQVAEGDAALQKEINDFKAALAKAESDLTAAYKKAIEDAISESNGDISTQLVDIKTSLDIFNADINSINQQIAVINASINELKNNFANRIQSLTYIPTHTDGKATMTYNATSGKWEAELSFFVTPKSVIEKMAQGHISAKGVYTASTRAVDLIDLSVIAFERDATNGTITVTVSGDNLTNFLNGTSDAAVFLIISDGNSEFVSDYVPVALKNMSADDLKAAVTQALNDGVRDFTITGNLTEEQQKAVGTALNDWCHTDSDGKSHNLAGLGTVTLTLPDVKVIVDRAFRPNEEYGGDALKSIHLPEATIIGEYAFDGQSQLQSIIAPKVTEVKTKGLYNCGALTNVQMPNITTVGQSAFAWTGITTYPWDNLQSIGRASFSACTGISGVISLPEATSIDIDAFMRCSNLTGIIAPKVETIGSSAFSYCPNLTELTFSTAIESVGGQFLHNGNQPLYSENITLTLAVDQKKLSGGDNTSYYSSWAVADGAATVEFGTGKTFCGYTFKEIKKYGE